MAASNKQNKIVKTSQFVMPSEYQRSKKRLSPNKKHKQTEPLAARVALLETEVVLLKEKLKVSQGLPWWRKISGTFANDDAHAEAMALGRKYRESLRPANTFKPNRISVKKTAV